MTKPVLIVVLVVAVVAAYWLFFMQPGNTLLPVPGGSGDNGGGQVFCTQEAKLCPDGSYVGRTGPNCEFAPCPTTGGSGATEATVQAQLNVSVSALGVALVPLIVEEDSRCPEDVQCIQAGRVRLRTKIVSGLGESQMVFILGGEAITTETEEIALTDVTPVPNTQKQILPSDYRFTFLIKKR